MHRTPLLTLAPRQGHAQRRTRLSQNVLQRRLRCINQRLLYGSRALGYLVGPLIGGLLAQEHYSLPFWVTAVALVAIWWFVFSRFKETHPPEQRVKVSYFKAFTNLSGVVTYKRLRPYFLMNFCFFVATFGFFRGYPMFLVERFGMQVEQVSLRMVWVAVPVVVCNFWMTGHLSRLFPARGQTLWAGLGLGLFCIANILPVQAWPLWITLFLTALSLAIVMPQCATLISMAARPEEQGRVMGNNQSLQLFGEGLAGVGAGLLLAASADLVLIVPGIAAFLGVVVLSVSSIGK